jgi:hypothetical protein
MRRALPILIASLPLLACPASEPGEELPFGPETVVQTIAQTADPESDVLFAVDNSGSMLDEHAALVDNFDAFATFLFQPGVDYHIGIVRAEVSGGGVGELVGPVHPYIDPTVPNPEDVLQDNVDALGAAGGPCESGLKASYQALTPPQSTGVNAGFLRPDANLSVVVITDEDDQGCTCASAGSCPSTWATWFTGLKASVDQLSFCAIAGYAPTNNTTPDDCSGAGGTAAAATNLDTVLPLVPGMTWSVCDDDWTSILGHCGAMAAGTALSFALQSEPSTDDDDFDADRDTGEPMLLVEYSPGYPEAYRTLEPDDAEHGWSFRWESNSVAFEPGKAPLVGATLRFSYLPAASNRP